MSGRSSIRIILLTTFVIWMGARATAIALPLVALEQTGEEWSTGIVLGAQAVPLLSVPWWGRALARAPGRRTRTRGRPRPAGGGARRRARRRTCGRLGVTALTACGLIVGAAAALYGPGIRALLADVGDAVGPGRAARGLAWQDFAHRATMFLAPPLGALAVGHGHTLTLLWSECLAVLLAAGLLAAVPGIGRRAPKATPGRPGETCDRAPGGPAATPDQAPRPVAAAGLTGVLRAHPRMTASILVHGTVTLTWFAFSLGLAILGAQTGRPGVLIAAGMTGYGLASTLTSFLAPALVTRLPAWPTCVLPAMALGATYVVLPATTASVTAVALVAAAGGATMPFGIAAHNRLLSSDPPPGPERRAAFTADAVTAGGAAAVGMSAGGALIGVAGVAPALVGAGLVQIAATAVALTLVRARPGENDRVTGAPGPAARIGERADDARSRCLGGTAATAARSGN